MNIKATNQLGSVQKDPPGTFEGVKTSFVSVLRGFNLGSFGASRLESALEGKRDQITRSKSASKEGWERRPSQKRLVPWMEL